MATPIKFHLFNIFFIHYPLFVILKFITHRKLIQFSTLIKTKFFQTRLKILIKTDSVVAERADILLFFCSFILFFVSVGVITDKLLPSIEIDILIEDIQVTQQFVTFALELKKGN